MPYSPQGLRDIVASSRSNQGGDPDVLSRLRQAIMRSGHGAADILRRIPGISSSDSDYSSMLPEDMNNLSPMSGDTPVTQALPAELPDSGSYALNSPRGSKVMFQSQLDADNGEEMNDITNPNSPARREAEYYSKDETAPTSGKQALAGQYADVEKLLGKYTDDKDDNKFSDFLKLTLARAAMSKDNNYLSALSQGAGQATIDSFGQQDKREKNRLEAIDKILQARRYGASEDLQRQELDIKKPLYAAQADYYKDRGNKPDKPTRIPIGFDGAATKALKDNLGDKFDDLEPDSKTQIKSAAADIWKQAGGTLSPSQAVDEAMSQLGELQDKSPWYKPLSNKYGFADKAAPSLAEIDEAIARKEAARGSQ